MHSRKSIFYRGIVFIVSIFAMAIFTQVNVKAESLCDVILTDNNPYLTFGGSNSNWSDSGIKYSGPCSSDEIGSFETLGTYVNGNQVERFVPANYGSGYYTIEYKYKFSGENKSLFRYVRILDASFDTSKNYSLGAFKVFTADANSKVDAQIVNAFYDSNSKRIVNFVVNNKATFVIVEILLLF